MRKLSKMARPLKRSGDRSGKRFPREIAVLYEDGALIAVDKPPGLPAVPIPGSNVPSAWSVVSGELKRKGERALIVHRIDRFTSGILLFAKTHKDRDALIRQFLAHTPVREYLAVIRGRLESDMGTLVHYFRRQGMFQKLTKKSDPEGARAELHYSVERRFREASLVRVRLVTGLQNQIRVQFAAIGHPVIGDRKYSGAEAAEQRIDRVALHAAHLELIHPRSGREISIDCPPPRDFCALVDGLDKQQRDR